MPSRTSSLKSLFWPHFWGRLLVLCILGSGGLPSSSHADFAAAEKAYKAGEFAAALKELRILSDKDDPRAQLSLSIMHAKGQGTPPDIFEAYVWATLSEENSPDDVNREKARNVRAKLLDKMAPNEISKAQKALAVKKNRNRNVTTDFATALMIYKNGNTEIALKELLAIAEKSDGKTQSQVAQMYFEGKTLPQNSVEALKWFKKAAENGSPEAVSRIATIYGEGKGIPNDPNEAFKWYKQAAEKGDIKAQVRLGEMYSHGQGVKEDPVEAEKWFQSAADKNHPTGLYNLGLIASKKNDVIMTYVWLNLAVDTGKLRKEQADEAHKFLSTIQEDLSVEELDGAKKIMNDWRTSKGLPLKK